MLKVKVEFIESLSLIDDEVSRGRFECVSEWMQQRRCHCVAALVLKHWRQRHPSRLEMYLLNRLSHTLCCRHCVASIVLRNICSPVRDDDNVLPDIGFTTGQCVDIWWTVHESVCIIIIKKKERSGIDALDHCVDLFSGLSSAGVDLINWTAMEKHPRRRLHRTGSGLRRTRPSDGVGLQSNTVLGAARTSSHIQVADASAV